MPTFTFPIISQCKLQVAIATKACNIISAEANVVNISAKFQLHPHTASEEKIFFFFKFILLVAMEPNQIQPFGQNPCLVQNYTRNMSVKHLSKYLQ